MRLSPFQALAFVLLTTLLSCGRLEFKTTIAPSPAIPAVMEGEWRGTWTSTATPVATPAQGTLLARLQTFGDQPVVRFETDNLCLQGIALRFVMVGRHVEIVSGEQVLFSGDTTADRHAMTGTYACGSDQGQWSATWTRALAPIGDVTGSWIGSFTSLAPPLQVALLLNLTQTYDDGKLLVSGEVSVPGTDLILPIHTGMVEWNDGGFLLLLTTDPASLPLLQMQGLGTPNQLVVPQGALRLVPGSGLPTLAGMWNASFVAR